MADIQEIEKLRQNPKIQAMLRVIRTAEGADYNTRVGGGKFSDLSKKPGQKVYIPSIKDYSSAEGAYQFLNSTWEGVSKKLGLKDFSPYSQDLGAIELIRQRGALDDILNDRFETAINKLSKEWASLPTAEGKGYYKGQKARKIDFLKKTYNLPTAETPQNESKPFEYIPAVSGEAPSVTGVNFQEQEETDEENKASEKLLQESFNEEVIEPFQQQVVEQIPQQEQQEEYYPNYQVELQPIEYTPIQQFQDGGTLDREFIKNWYQNRKTILDENDNRIEVPKYNFNYNPSVKIDPTLPKNVQGEFNPRNKEISLNPDNSNVPGIFSHELNHYVQDQYSPQDFSKMIRTPAERIIDENVENKVRHLGGYGNYLLEPDEIHSRLMQFRQSNQIRPNEEIDLNRVKNSKDKELLKLDMFSDEQLKDLLNKTVSVDKFQNKQFIAKYGGELPISSKGLYEYPNTPVLVPTEGSITMRKIDYPVLATSLETGESKILQPNQFYTFKNTKNIIETPL